MRGISIRLLALLFSTLLTLVVAEIGLRIIIGPGDAKVSHHELLCEYDPLLGWRKIPGAEKRYTTTEYDIHERINANGLRGPMIDYEKPPNTYRILALGDSFTEGYTVEEEEIYTQVLRRDLEARDPSRAVDVVNGGTGGYSTDQELLFFRSEGSRYRPDLVILLFVTNDVWFNAQAAYPRAPKPLFELRDDELVLVNTPVPRPDADADLAEQAAPATDLQRVRLAVSNHSMLYRFVRDRIKGTHWLHSAAIRLGLTDPTGEGAFGESMPIQWQVLKREPVPAAEHAWMITERLLTTLRAEVEAQGARFVVVNMPPEFALYEDEWGKIARSYGVDTSAWNPSAVAERLARVCARQGIDYHDLTPTFRAAIDSGLDRPDPFYLPIDGHWNAKGHRLAGTDIAEFVANVVADDETQPAEPKGLVAAERDRSGAGVDSIGGRTRKSRADYP